MTTNTIITERLAVGYRRRLLRELEALDERLRVLPETIGAQRTGPYLKAVQRRVERLESPWLQNLGIGGHKRDRQLLVVYPYHDTRAEHLRQSALVVAPEGTAWTPLPVAMTYHATERLIQSVGAWDRHQVGSKLDAVLTLFSDLLIENNGMSLVMETLLKMPEDGTELLVVAEGMPNGIPESICPDLPSYVVKTVIRGDRLDPHWEERFKRLAARGAVRMHGGLDGTRRYFDENGEELP